MLRVSRKFFLTVFCSIFVMCFYAHGSTDPQEGLSTDVQRLNFHFIIPTNGPTHLLNRQGTLKLEFRNTPFSEMKQTLRKCLEVGCLPSFEERAPLLYIYLPSQETYQRYKRFLAAEAQAQFEEIYPGITLKIKFRVVNTNINVVFIYNKMKMFLKNLRREYANDREAQGYIKTLEAATDSAFQQSAGLEVIAPVARKIKFTMASTRFAIVGATRTMQTFPILAGGGAPAAAAMALIVTDATTEFFTVAFTQSIQRTLASWPLYSNETPLRAQLAQIVNNSIWNFILFSVGRPTIMQAIAHASNENVPLPNLNSVGEIAGFSAVGVGFYSMFTHGYNSLRDKGWISASQIDIVLQITGLFDLATGIINSNPHWYGYRIFTLGPQWLFYAMIGALGRLAPNRTDKILAVESSVLDWQDVHGEHTADASWHITNDQDFSLAIEHYQKNSKVLNCGQLFGLHP
jgi:hypothetical protein